MKRFDDLTDAEVLALSGEEVQRYIDLECAFAGAPLVPPAPVAPEPFRPDTDVDVYSVGNIMFRSREDAERVAHLANGCPRYSTGYYRGDYRHSYVQPEDGDVSVQHQRSYSAPARARDAGLLSESVRATTEYERAKKAFDEAVRVREGIADPILERINRLNAIEMRRGRLRRELERYMELAGGQAPIARAFLLNAYPLARELLPELAEATVAEVPGMQAPAAAPADAEELPL